MIAITPEKGNCMNRVWTHAFLTTFIACGGLIASSAMANVRLPAIFGSNMVLQQGAPVVVWGWAETGEEVTVSVAGQEVAVTTDKGGKWSLKLAPLKSGGPVTMVVQGRNRIELTNILVGEVWLCSGQSNMGRSVASAQNATQEIAQAKYPTIRLFRVASQTSPTPLDDVQGEWVECSPETVAKFSAVAYYFGRELHQRLSVPVGLIHASWLGTPIEPWTPLEAMEAEAEFRPEVERWRKSVAGFPAVMAAYEKRLAEYRKEHATQPAAQAGTAGTPDDPKAPKPPLDPGHVRWSPSVIYNGMIHPLMRFGLAGVAWYQGEGNVPAARQYRKRLPLLIQSWRRNAGQELPFLIVQIANYGPVKDEPVEGAWAELREAQAMALSLPRTCLAVTIDIGDANDLHPANKQEVGARLALAAMKVAYGKDLVYSGPIYESMRIEDGAIRVKFKHVGGGLVTKNDQPVKGFAVAGEDRKFVWAEAKIDRDAVVVRSDKVDKPVALRYAWADNPACNLYNKEGLPACPFRTDDGPGVTAVK